MCVEEIRLEQKQFSSLLEHYALICQRNKEQEQSEIGYFYNWLTVCIKEIRS